MRIKQSPEETEEQQQPESIAATSQQPDTIIDPAARKLDPAPLPRFATLAPGQSDGQMIPVQLAGGTGASFGYFPRAGRHDSVVADETAGLSMKNPDGSYNLSRSLAASLVERGLLVWSNGQQDSAPTA